MKRWLFNMWRSISFSRIYLWFFSPSLIFIHLSLLLREWQWVEHFYSTQKRRDERCVFQTTAVSLWIKFHSNTERNKTNCFFESHLKSNLDTFFIREISVKTRNQNIFLIRASHSVHNKQRQQRRQQHLHGTIFQLRLIGPSKKSISSGALSLSPSPPPPHFHVPSVPPSCSNLSLVRESEWERLRVIPKLAARFTIHTILYSPGYFCLSLFLFTSVE